MQMIGNYETVPGVTISGPWEGDASPLGGGDWAVPPGCVRYGVTYGTGTGPGKFTLYTDSDAEGVVWQQIHCPAGGGPRLVTWWPGAPGPWGTWQGEA